MKRKAEKELEEENESEASAVLSDRQVEYLEESAEASTTVPDLQKKGIYVQIQEIVRYIAQKAESLLCNYTNNAVECFNALMAKYTSGKRLNLTQRGSYTIRVHLAVLQYNSGKKGLSTLTSQMEQEPPKMLVSLETQRIEECRKRRPKKCTEKTEQPPKKKLCMTKDHDYGTNVEEPDLEEEIFNLEVENHMAMLRSWQSRREEIEKETVRQFCDDKWQYYRRKLLTASNFGQVCRRKPDTLCCKLVERLIYQHSFSSAATQYGKDHEEEARKQLSEKLQVPIRNCGLFIDSEIPYLGASPDGLIGEDTLVEIKCPESANAMTPELAIETLKPIRSIFAKNQRKRRQTAKVKKGKVDKEENPFHKKNSDPALNEDSTLCSTVTELNREHKYFYQVQGQLHITGRQYCIFCLWTPYGLKHVKVERDDEFWRKEMQPKLQRFYEDCMLPEYINSRYNRGMPIREPQYILDERARNEKLQKHK